LPLLQNADREAKLSVTGNVPGNAALCVIDNGFSVSFITNVDFSFCVLCFVPFVTGAPVRIVMTAKNLGPVNNLFQKKNLFLAILKV
jgi:hypothetical protein